MVIEMSEEKKKDFVWSVIVNGKSIIDEESKEKAVKKAEEMDLENYRVVTKPIMDTNLYF